MRTAAKERIRENLHDKRKTRYEILARADVSLIVLVPTGYSSVIFSFLRRDQALSH